MRKNEIESLIEATAQRTATMVVEQLKGIVRIPGQTDEDEYVDCRTAAKILGVTAPYLRSKLKDRFPYKKVGESSQGRILFLRSGLVQNYIGH